MVLVVLIDILKFVFFLGMIYSLMKFWVSGRVLDKYIVFDLVYDN